MQGFVYDQPATRVIFGVRTLDRITEELKRLGAKRALVLATPEQRKDAEDVSRRLGGMSAGVYAEAVMHVPIETARKAREEAKRLDADCYVAVGGGSTVGLGKAIALESGLPILAVPTTYAGSEMTPIYGITEGGLKRTGRDRKVLPKTVVYDPTLTVTHPTRIRSFRCWRSKGFERSRGRCPSWCRHRLTSRLAPMRSMAPGSPARH